MGLAPSYLMPTLASFTHRRFIVLNQSTSVAQAAQVMCENHIGCLLVGDDEGRAKGIITDRDLVCRWAKGFDGRDVSIERIMTSALLTIPEDSSIADVLRVMEAHGVRRIPVVRQVEGRIQFSGIVTLDDLLASNLITPGQISRIVHRQTVRRWAEAEEHRAANARSEERSKAHQEQTLAHFYARIAKETGVTNELTKKVTQAILGSLVMRVALPAASHLLAQLPRLVREPLLRLPPGPDRSFSPAKIVNELAVLLQKSPSDAEEVLRRFIRALQSDTLGQALEHLSAQLPTEFQAYFAHEAPLSRVADDPEPTFANRDQAARALAAKLERFKGKRPLVLGIPRGSVPMAKTLADLLYGELDIVLVHKIGAPDNPEYAIGSVSEFGEIYRSQAIECYKGSSEMIDRIAQAEIANLRKRREAYSLVHPPISPTGRIVIIVDDGIATGSTALAAVRAIRSRSPARIIVAAPVASPRAVGAIEREADEVVAVRLPEDFYSISQFYDDFPQVSDEEVLGILTQAGRPSRLARGSAA